MANAHIKFPNCIPVLYWPYDKALSCDDAQAAFDALTPAQKLAQLSASEPAYQGGAQQRNCSAIASNTDDPAIDNDFSNISDGNYYQKP